MDAGGPRGVTLGPLLPLTGRIVIEWGVEEELARLRE